MKQVYKGEWAGCSNFKERKEELFKAHEEFLKMQAKGFTLKEVKVKRPRIKRENFKIIITCFGPMKITIEEYHKHCMGFKTV